MIIIADALSQLVYEWDVEIKGKCLFSCKRVYYILFKIDQVKRCYNLRLWEFEECNINLVS